MSTIKAVCFDVGGVLTTGIAPAMMQAAQSGGVDLAVLGPTLRKLFIEENRRDHPGHALECGRLSFEEFVEAVGNFGPEIRTLMHPDSPHCMYRFIDRSEPMHEFVDEVRTAGYRTGIISNVLTEWLGLWETFTHPIDRFETVIYSCLDGMRKPDLEIFTTALERLGLAGNEVLYLDDGPGMVDVARRAGMNAVLVDDHDRAIDEARKLLAM